MAIKSSTTTEIASSFLEKYIDIADGCGYDDEVVSMTKDYLQDHDCEVLFDKYRIDDELIAEELLERRLWMFESSMLKRMPIKQQILYRLPTITLDRKKYSTIINVEFNNKGDRLIKNTYYATLGQL